MNLGDIGEMVASFCLFYFFSFDFEKLRLSDILYTWASALVCGLVLSSRL